MDGEEVMGIVNGGEEVMGIVNGWRKGDGNS